MTSVNPSTVYRWTQNGILLPSGARVRLEAERIGATWFTSKEAIGRFVEQLNAQARCPPVQTPAERRRESEVAEAELAKLGM